MLALSRLSSYLQFSQSLSPGLLPLSLVSLMSVSRRILTCCNVLSRAWFGLVRFAFVIALSYFGIGFVIFLPLLFIVVILVCFLDTFVFAFLLFMVFRVLSDVTVYIFFFFFPFLSLFILYCLRSKHPPLVS